VLRDLCVRIVFLPSCLWVLGWAGAFIIPHSDFIIPTGEGLCALRIRTCPGLLALLGNSPPFPERFGPRQLSGYAKFCGTGGRGVKFDAGLRIGESHDRKPTDAT